MRPSFCSSAEMSMPSFFRSTPRFCAQLNTAASSASSPITEQWIFCLGKPSRYFTMSLFLIFKAVIGVRPPCSIKAQRASEAAMAEVQPNVRYRASVITSCVGSVGWRFTRKVKRMASPQAIEPCSPTPSGSSISPKCVPGLPWTASMKSCLVFSLYSQAIIVSRFRIWH